MYDPLIVLSVQKNHNKVNTTMHKIIFVYKTVEKKGEQQQIKKKMKLHLKKKKKLSTGKNTKKTHLHKCICNEI
jgi:hypothetical protein